MKVLCIQQAGSDGILDKYRQMTYGPLNRVEQIYIGSEYTPIDLIEETINGNLYYFLKLEESLSICFIISGALLCWAVVLMK